MDQQFERFMQFCEGYLDNSTKQLLTLAKKRYHECDEEYKQSQEFLCFILCTEAKIDSDESRFFVHLRDFLNTLKDNKARNDYGNENQDIDAGRSKRVHDSSESENDFACSAKRRKTDENEKGLGEYEGERDEDSKCDQTLDRAHVSSEYAIPGKSFRLHASEPSSEDNKSDQEMEIAPHTTELDMNEDQMHGSQNVTTDEICESGSIARDESDFAELEDEKNEEANSGKEKRNSTNLSDFDRIVFQGDDENENVREKIEVSKARSYEKAIKEINAMFSSSEDEANEEDTRTATDIENIIQEQDDEGLIRFSPADNERCSSSKEVDKKIDEDVEIDELNAYTKDYFVSQEILNKGPSETDASAYVAASNESRDILNISSETEEKMESNLFKQNDRLNKEGSSEISSELESCTDQDSRNEKWDKSEVLVIENEAKPLCITIKRVKGTKTEESVPENSDLRHFSVNKDQKKRRCADLNSGEEVTIIDDEESDSNHDDDVLISNTTVKFGEESESESDDEGTGEESEVGDEDKMHKDVKVNDKKDKELSSDDEDPFDAAKAKKFRERCKKKYVVSVGKRKNKGFSSSSKDHLKPTLEIKTEKEKSHCKKRTPNNSPKCKKKCSPNKSPIIIFTDSESDSDISDMVGFKKKFDEKVKKRFQMQDNSSKVIKKSPAKVEPMEVDDDTESGTDVKRHKYESSKENRNYKKDLDRAYDSDNKKSTVVKEIKEKKRVNLITEEYYSSKYDRNDSTSKQDKEKKPDRQEERGKDKHKHKSEEKPWKQKANKHEREDDDEQPGPSSASDGGNAKKKGSTRQIRKLEALLESIRNQIEKVRKRELGLDEMDSGASDYILEDKLQRKFMKVWDKLCELHKAIRSTGRPTDKYFRYQGTRYPDINRKLEKFINKKKVFPDYHDVRSIIMKVNKEKKLHLKSREMDDLSREAFTDVGNQLQRRRQKDFISTFHSSGGDHVNPFSLYDDPALYDPELKRKLDANKKFAKSNMEKVVEKYAALQYQVGDKTDDEGDDDDEEEEEEDNDNNEDELDQLTGVDNSDSDNNTAADDKNVVSAEDKSSGKTWDSSPCLEIENLENGKKSSFSHESPDDLDKLSSMKPIVKEEMFDRDPKEKHFSEQLGLCRTPVKDVKKEIDTTVTILSDNDDDNEVKCTKDEEKDGLDDTSGKQSSSVSDDSQKMFTSVAESSKESSSSSEKIGNETVEKIEVDAKNTSEVSNVTIITDDEDEEENVSDQSLGLKIVSAHHVSLSDISKLHGEDESDVAEEVNKSGNDEPKDFKDSLNSSGESGPVPVKVQLEIVEKMDNKTKVPDVKEKPIEIKKPSSKDSDKITNKINEVLNSEPEVMIIEDVDAEVLPVSSKGWNVQLQKINNTKKSNFAPDHTKRYQPSSSNANRLMDGNIKVTSPMYPHSNTTYPVSSSGWNVGTQKHRNDVTKSTSSLDHTQQYSSSTSSVNRFMGGSSKVTSPVKANSDTLNPVLSKSWNVQPQKSAENVNRSNRVSKCMQQFPPNFNNSNRFIGTSSKVNTPLKTNSNTWHPLSNNAWNVHQQKVGKSNSGSNSSQSYTSCSKPVNTFSDGNSKRAVPLKSNTYSTNPVANKSWNAQPQVHDKSVKKSNSTSQCTQRFPSGANNMNKFTGSYSKATFPTKSNSNAINTALNKGRNIQGQNLGNYVKKSGNGNVVTNKMTSSSKQVSKDTTGNSKITSPSFRANSKTINDVVVIDCDETEQIDTKTKCTKNKTNSVRKLESTSDVICIDDAEVEGSGKVAETKSIIKHTHNTSKSVAESKDANVLRKTDLKGTPNSSSSLSSPKTKGTSKGSVSKVSEISQSSVSKPEIERSKCKYADKTLQEASSSVVKSKTEENNSSSKLKKVDMVVEINEEETSKEMTSEEACTSGIEVKQNISEAGEGRQSPSDIFAGSFGTVESNEYGSIESCHDSEVFENPEPPDGEQSEELPVDGNTDSVREESPPTEIFTAMKLGTVHERVESSIDDAVEDELPTSGLVPEKADEKTVKAKVGNEFENDMKSNNEKLTLARIGKDQEENVASKGNVESRTNLILTTTLKADVHPASEDEQEVSGGFEDEDNISSTSSDIENLPKVKLIRNKLLQLKKAMVNSKPQLEVKSQAKSQDTTSRLSRSPGNAQWIEEDENAGLIETYQEPDSTPYSLAENLISSSSNENIIVLSDSE